jgi:hypothetical protein
VFDKDCPVTAPFCINDACHNGDEGDPCVFDSDCDPGAKNCVNDLCHDGSPGDACVFDSDCLSANCLDDDSCA